MDEPLERFPTGIRKTTIANPYYLEVSGTVVARHSGIVRSDLFSLSMTRRLDSISEVLKRNGLEFEYMALLKWKPFEGRGVHQTRFVLTAPGIVWEKYESSGNLQAGQNRIYVASTMISAAGFCALPEEEQDLCVRLHSMTEDELLPIVVKDVIWYDKLLPKQKTEKITRAYNMAWNL